MRAARLTAKQETFADSIAAGQTQAAAYRAAYDAADMAPATVWNEASRLVRHPEVAQRLALLQQEAEYSAATRREVTRDFVFQELAALAIDAPTSNARLKALELLGKTVGMFTDRVQVEEVERSVEEIEASIRMRMGASVSG